MAKNPNHQSLTPRMHQNKIALKQIDLPAAVRGYLEQMMEVERSPKQERYVKNKDHTLRATSTKCDNDTGKGEITIAGTSEDIRLIELMILGTSWIRRGLVGVEESKAYHDAPSPINDPKLEDHWPIEPLVTPSSQYKLFVDEDEHEKQARAKGKMDFRSIYVSGITAYASGDIYVARAKLLDDAGFICLRSRRGDDGKYWEIWYLAGPTNAQGAIKGKNSDEIVNWLCKVVGPGSISIEGVHWGAVLD